MFFPNIRGEMVIIYCVWAFELVAAYSNLHKIGSTLRLPSACEKNLKSLVLQQVVSRELKKAVIGGCGPQLVALYDGEINPQNARKKAK